MKKAENTKKHIKQVYTNKLQITTGSDLDKRVLTNSINTLKNAKITNPANIWPTLARSRITQIAAVFIIVSAICLYSLSENNGTGSGIAAQATTPSELLSLVSLNIAFREGDMEAVEKQLDKAEKMTKPKQNERLTIDQLICDLDGC